MKKIVFVLVLWVALVPCKVQAQFLASNSKAHYAFSPSGPLYPWASTDLYQIWERLDSICPTSALASYTHYNWRNTDLYQIWLKLDSCFGGGGSPVIVSDSAWMLTGNTGTNAASNFLGTLDSVDLVIRTKDSIHAHFTAFGTMSLYDRHGIDYDTTRPFTEQLLAGNQLIGDDSTGYQMINGGDTARSQNNVSLGLFNAHRFKEAYGNTFIGNGICPYGVGSYGFAGHNPGTPYGYLYENLVGGFLAAHNMLRGQESVILGCKAMYQNIHPNGAIAIGLSSAELSQDTTHGTITIGYACARNWTGSTAGSITITGTNGMINGVDNYNITAYGGGVLGSEIHGISIAAFGESTLDQATGSGHTSYGFFAGHGCTNANFMKHFGQECGLNLNASNWSLYGDGYNLSTPRQDTTQTLWVAHDLQDSSLSTSKMNGKFGVNDGSQGLGKIFACVDNNGYGHWSTPVIDTTSGDTATINASLGRFRKDSTGTTFTLTNNYVSANSIIFITLASDPGNNNAHNVHVVAGSGSFVLTFENAPSVNTDVNFIVIN